MDFAPWIAVAGFIISIVTIAIRVENRFGQVEREQEKRETNLQRELNSVRNINEARISTAERRCAELSEKLAEHKLQISERLRDYPTKQDFKDAIENITDPIVLRIGRVEVLLERAFGVGAPRP